MMVDDDVPFLCRMELLDRELSSTRTSIGLGRAFDNARRRLMPVQSICIDDKQASKTE